MPDRRLIGAEILKLRRRRGMLAVGAFLTVGAVALYYAILVVLHARPTPPRTARPAASARSTTRWACWRWLAGVTGVIVGATAGGADVEAGVFRDLAATGRSRTALFAARLPGALAVVVPLLAAAVLLRRAARRSRWPAASRCTAKELWQGSIQVLVGRRAARPRSASASPRLSGARGMVMGVVLAFYLGVAPLLAQVEAIGDARNVIPQVATARLGGARRRRARARRRRSASCSPGSSCPRSAPAPGARSTQEI